MQQSLAAKLQAPLAQLIANSAEHYHQDHFPLACLSRCLFLHSSLPLLSFSLYLVFFFFFWFLHSVCSLFLISPLLSSSVSLRRSHFISHNVSPSPPCALIPHPVISCGLLNLQPHLDVISPSPSSISCRHCLSSPSTNHFGSQRQADSTHLDWSWLSVNWAINNSSYIFIY